MNIKIGTSRTICATSSNFAIHIERHTHIHHVEWFRLPLQTRSEESSPTIFNAPTHKFRFGKSDHLGDLDCLISKKNFFHSLPNPRAPIQQIEACGHLGFNGFDSFQYLYRNSRIVPVGLFQIPWSRSSHSAKLRVNRHLNNRFRQMDRFGVPDRQAHIRPYEEFFIPRPTSSYLVRHFRTPRLSSCTLKSPTVSEGCDSACPIISETMIEVFRFGRSKGLDLSHKNGVSGGNLGCL